MIPFLEIRRYRDFNRDISPKIDSLATKQGKSRSDIIRDILYARFNYIPLPRSQDQINEDYIEEQREEQKIKDCIVVKVDREYRQMFFEYLISQPGRLDHKYRRHLNEALYHYFDKTAPKLLK